MSRFSNLITPRGDWVKDYPSTNARIIVGIRLSVGYVVFNCVLIALGAYYDFDVKPWVVDIDYATGVFVAAMAAFSFGQFWAKRGTDNGGRDAKQDSVTVTTGSPPTTVKVDTAPAVPQGESGVTRLHESSQ